MPALPRCRLTTFVDTYIDGVFIGENGSDFFGVVVVGIRIKNFTVKGVVDVTCAIWVAFYWVRDSGCYFAIAHQYIGIACIGEIVVRFK